MTPHTAAEKLTEIKREIAMRRRVCPRFVANGRMKQDDADYRLAVMESIAADYAVLAEKERLL